MIGLFVSGSSAVGLLPLLASTMNVAADYLVLRRELLHGPDHGALLLATSGGRLPQGWMQDHLAKLSRTIGFRLHPRTKNIGHP